MPITDGSGKATNEIFKEEKDMNTKCATRMFAAAVNDTMVVMPTIAQSVDSLPCD